jgi:hypothetical protein
MLCKGRPLRGPSVIAALIYLPRPSAISKNKKGERGSPCLMPPEGEKGLDGIPFTRMEKKVEEAIFRI